MTCTAGNQARALTGIIIHDPIIHQISIEQIEVLFPRLKTSPDNGFRNIMAALPNTLGNPCNRSFRSIELQEDQLHSVAIVSPAWNQRSGWNAGMVMDRSRWTALAAAQFALRLPRLPS